ncbi:hypothetical protein ILYODFUR_015695 [Ilyodon furcidens]|uniref:Uncharacterized protein n=1 Tax=Ilyodon furcidens TaxID=33524 RepID=A0ABV0TN05_9TELE
MQRDALTYCLITDFQLHSRKWGVSKCFPIHPETAWMERVERASAEWRDERENPVGVDGALADVRRKKEVRQKDGKTEKEVNVFRILSDQTSRSDTHPL